MKTKRYRTISEVTALLNIKQHVIRYLDSKYDGISIRLKDNKQRLFNTDNINKIKDLMNSSYKDGKNYYPLNITNKLAEKKLQKIVSINSSKEIHHKLIDINELKNISLSLKKILKNI
jgi:DNA-binding transcriptional MerR regulator